MGKPQSKQLFKGLLPARNDRSKGSSMGSGSEANDESDSDQRREGFDAALVHEASEDSEEGGHQVGLSATEAARQLKAARKSCVVVLRADGTVLGLLTEQDLVRKAMGGASTNPDVGSLLTRAPDCVEVEFELGANKDAAESFEKALALMAARSFRHVPLVRKADGTYVGCIDILGAIASAQADASSSLARTLSLPASKVLKLQASLDDSCGDALALASATAADAVCAMRRRRQTSLLVVDEAKALAGIVTESDLVRKVLAAGDAPEAVMVADVMTANPYRLSSGKGIDPYDGLREMIQRGFRHLPVELPASAGDAGTGAGAPVLTTLDILTLVKMSFKMSAPAEVPTGKVAESVDSVASKAASTSAPVTAPATASSPVAATRTPTTTTTTTTTKKTKTTTKTATATTTTAVTPPSAKEQEGVSLIMQNNFEGAVAALTEALGAPAVAGDSHVRSRILLRRGHVRSCTGDADGAVRDLAASLEVATHPKLIADATVVLCESLAESGRFEEAARRFLAASEREGVVLTDAQRADCAGQLAREAQRFKDVGKEVFVLRDFSGAAVAYTSALRALQASAQLESAECAVKADAMRAVLHSNRAACYQSLGDAKHALEDAEAAVQADATYGKAWVRVCTCLLEKGRFADCVARVQAADAALPAGDPTLTKLDWLRKSAEDKLAGRRANAMDSIKALGQQLETVVCDENAPSNPSNAAPQ